VVINRRTCGNQLPSLSMESSGLTDGSSKQNVYAVNSFQ
jgi:hypothetical protein